MTSTRRTSIMLPKDNNMKTFAITTSIACVLLSFLLGRVSVKCNDCIPQIEYKYIKHVHNEKEIEIKREVEKKINNIPNADVEQLDSIWSRYEQRYNIN